MEDILKKLFYTYHKVKRSFKIINRILKGDKGLSNNEYFKYDRYTKEEFLIVTDEMVARIKIYLNSV